MASSLFAATDYAAAIEAHLPRGRVWPRDPTSEQAQTLAVLAPEFAQVDADAQQLLIDAFPTTSVALLTEWEESLGLPDPCAGEAPTLAARQAQVGARLLQPGGQSRAFFIAFAASLGFQIDITVYAPFRVGLNSCVDRIFNDQWAFAWLIGVYAEGPQPVLECEIRRLASAETVVAFNYYPALLTEAGVQIETESGNPLFA